MRRVFLLALAVLMIAPVSLVSQKPGDSAQLPAIEEPRCAPDDWICRQRQREMEKKRNQLRHEELKADTDKLLALAQQLKRDVDQSSEHTLAYGVVKKADEIEQLAKDVKNKMRGW